MSPPLRGGGAGGAASQISVLTCPPHVPGIHLRCARQLEGRHGWGCRRHQRLPAQHSMHSTAAAAQRTQHYKIVVLFGGGRPLGAHPPRRSLPASLVRRRHRQGRRLCAGDGQGGGRPLVASWSCRRQPAVAPCRGASHCRPLSDASINLLALALQANETRSTAVHRQLTSSTKRCSRHKRFSKAHSSVPLDAHCSLGPQV